MSLHNRLIILSLHQYEHHKPEMRDVKMSLFSRTFRMVDGKTCMHDFGIVFHIRCPVPCPARHMMEGLTNKSPMFLFQSSIFIYTTIYSRDFTSLLHALRASLSFIFLQFSSSSCIADCHSQHLVNMLRDALLG